MIKRILFANMCFVMFILTGCHDRGLSNQSLPMDENNYSYYNKQMDYEAFLKFNGIMEEQDFDGDGNTDYLIRKTLSNTHEVVYYIKFSGKDDNVLLLGEFPQSYMLKVECRDIDNDQKNEIISLGIDDHSYNFQDTATFEIYKQNIWDGMVYWDLMRVPKGEDLMIQGMDWMIPIGYRKSGFDFTLLETADCYKLVLVESGQMITECPVIVSEPLTDLVNKNVSRPVYQYEISDSSSDIMYLYQNIGTSQIIIGTVVTTVKWTETGNYEVKEISFKNLEN